MSQRCICQRLEVIRGDRRARQVPQRFKAYCVAEDFFEGVG